MSSSALHLSYSLSRHRHHQSTLTSTSLSHTHTSFFHADPPSLSQLEFLPLKILSLPIFWRKSGGISKSTMYDDDGDETLLFLRSLNTFFNSIRCNTLNTIPYHHITIVTFFSWSEKQTFHENETDGLNLDDDDYSDQHHHHPLFCYPEKNKCIPSWKVENRHRKKKNTGKERRKEGRRPSLYGIFIFRKRETDKLTCCIIASACYWCCLCYSCTDKERGRAKIIETGRWCEVMHVIWWRFTNLLSFSFCCRQCNASIFCGRENCFKRSSVAKQAEKCKQNLCHIFWENQGKKGKWSDMIYWLKYCYGRVSKNVGVVYTSVCMCILIFDVLRIEIMPRGK